MKQRIITSTSLLFLATSFCYANGYTLVVANNIIVILIIIVIALIVIGGYSLYHNRIISQRNEQLRRILTALDDYRAIVGNEVLSLDEQENILNDKLSKVKEEKAFQKDDDQNFFVKMDARINKEKPFTDPDFDQDALLKFLGVSYDSFCKLVPRYKDPDRTLDYITPYGQNMLLSYSWSILTARQRRLYAGVASRILQHTKAPSGSPLASYLQSMCAA